MQTTLRRYAAWLSEEPDSALNRAVSHAGSLGAGQDMISFGGGQPASELYPLEALERAFSRALLEDGRACLPYGSTEGVPALRELIAERLRQRGIQVGPHNVLVTTGSLQGLHLVGRVFLDHGDTIITEAPTFMGALGTWEHQQPRYLSVPLDEHGVDVDGFEEAIRRAPRPPKFAYLLPTFQNPSGVSLSHERRLRVLEIAAHYDLVLIEDDPYGEFWFDERRGRTPPLRSLPGSEDHVIYLGTFSKILAPGIRLAYAVASEELVARLARAKRGVDFHTDTLVQQGVVRLCHDDGFDLAAHIARARAAYKQRRDAMLDALETEFSGQASWTRPDGGFFLWVELPDGAKAEDIALAALKEGVFVFSGGMFFPEGNGGNNALRLSYSNASPERIPEGIRRLARAVATVGA